MNFGPFLKENKLHLGGNTLGFVLGEISRVCFLKRRTLEEEEDNGGEEGSFNAKFVSSLSFPFFFLLMVVFTFPLKF